MNLYHGGTDCIKAPRLLEIPKKLDFGNGFYTTTNYEQNESWDLVKQKRNENETDAFVSVYKFDENLFDETKYKIKIFEQANENWLDFVITNRNSNQIHNFDIIKNPVANDNLFSTITLFEAGILTKEETIRRLKPHRLFDQISFHTKKSILELKFINCKKAKI